MDLRAVTKWLRVLREEARAPGLVPGEDVREEVQEGRGRDHEGTGCAPRFSLAAIDDFPACPCSETDSPRFSVSLTLFCCYRRISFSVLRCHILPCLSFNVLIEKKNVLRMPFVCSFFFFFGLVFFFDVINFDGM